MFNREVNALTRHLRELAKLTVDNPARFAGVMDAARVVGKAIQESNPKIDLDKFEKTIRGF